MQTKVFLLFLVHLSILLSFCGSKEPLIQGIKPNLVDSLTKPEDFLKLLQKEGGRFNNYKITPLKYSDPSFQALADSLKITHITKVDLDKNGLTDFILQIKREEYQVIIAFLDIGGKYQIIDIHKGMERNAFVRVRMYNNEPVLDYYYLFRNRRNYPNEYEIHQKTLTYKFGDLIERNASLECYKIETIEFETKGCFGMCPIYQIQINKDRSILYNPIEFCEERYKSSKTIGTLGSKVSEKEYVIITELLNYIDFTKLDTSYAVNWTDDARCKLKITYNNNKTKLVWDYGMQGTHGLRSLYMTLDELRYKIKWH